MPSILNCFSPDILFQLLSGRELSELVKSIYFIVLAKLCNEHFHTALDIGQTSECQSVAVVAVVAVY